MTASRDGLRNAPPPFEDVNLYASDVVLQEAVAREGGLSAARQLNAFGIVCGSSEAAERARLANLHPPALVSHDRYGVRIDRLDHHPAFHDLMQTSLSEGLGAGPVASRLPGPETRAASAGRHVARGAGVFLAAQSEVGHLASLSTTAAAVEGLAFEGGLPEDWLTLAGGRGYDPSPQPVIDKRHARLTLAVTERQAGADLRALTTLAKPSGGASGPRTYKLSGQKWLVTAPSADGLVVLAHAPGGLSLFLVPRLTAEGRLNGLAVIRLRRMSGLVSEALADLQLDAAEGLLLGTEGEGGQLLASIQPHLRLDAGLIASGLMRSALAQAIHFAEHRVSQSRRLIDEPARGEVLADLALEVEAAVALVFRLARAFDLAEDLRARAWRRVMTPTTAFLVGRTAPAVLAECLECHGGDGASEDLPLARMVRDVQAASLAHADGNVCVLDLIETLQRAPEAIEIVMEDLRAAAGDDPHLTAAHVRIERILCEPRLLDRRGRDLVVSLAVLAAGTLLRAHAPVEVADAYIATRLGSLARHVYGQGIDWADRATILARATPNR